MDGAFHFSGSSVGKDCTCNAGDMGSIPGLGKSPGEGNSFIWGFSGGASRHDWSNLAAAAAAAAKNPPANAGDIRDVGSIPGSGRSPGGGRGNPLQHSCLDNPYGQKSLVGYSPWDRKELEMTV